jgi:protein Tex
MTDIEQLLARELNLTHHQVANALQLLKEGGTVPFIARYRKERTGEMDEVQLHALFDRYAYLMDLAQRKKVVLESIEKQGKLTDQLREQIMACLQKTELEDLYLPYRPKKRTRATVARERGLEALADRIMAANLPDAADLDLEAEAAPYVSAEKGVATAEEALAGASDIIAEGVADKAQHRAHLREHILQHGVFTSAIKPEFPEGSTKFEMYRAFKIRAKEIHPHNMLALLRGEKEGILTIDMSFDEGPVYAYLENAEIATRGVRVRAFLKAVVRDAFDRLIRPSLVGEVRALRKEDADKESIRTFETNLRELLLSAPAGMVPTLGVDPGLRTGCKTVALDATGKFLEYQTLFPHQSEAQRRGAGETLRDMVTKHKAELIAIGNGTAGRETEQFVRDTVAVLEEKPVFVMVNEAGASVYSASPAAREEFPELDVTVRGAISIGRRLQDPLAELVKIDPKSIGVGQYQHDVDQKLLRKRLEETVQSCVNYVGVDVNTASRELLKYVAGVNAAIAKNVVAYRDEHGAFKSRDELRSVPKFGPKTFEQAAGFLRIRDGGNPLDNSAVHPESYGVVQTILHDIGLTVEQVGSHPDQLRHVEIAKYVSGIVGEPTIRDILAELQKPGRDPRAEFKYANFKEGVKEIKDLAPGMELEGVVTNVTNFGAFVDIGVHQDGLVHVSQLADKFVDDPKKAVKVGQVVRVRVLEVNEALKRISLTMKTPGARHKHPAHQNQKRVKGKVKEQERPARFTIDDLKEKFKNR